jgi:hypothetical protein
MWIKQANIIKFTSSTIAALDEIPVGIWLLKASPEGFYLEVAPPFRFPKKIYGDSESVARRYINTFAKQDSNLGILLTGMKGTGKSVTAKLTCHLSDRPVILVTEPFTGDGFKSFLSNISQEVLVFVDEFEKVYYDNQLQASFLSILDGIFDGKKMFLFTSNEKGRINEYMINRPGRVHYLKEYAELDHSIINAVIDDNLVLKENKKGLVEVLSILSNVTMDMLMSLIKEMNLYSETARQAVRFLNLRPEKQIFDVVVYSSENIRLGSTTYSSHPLASEKISLNIYSSDITKYRNGATNHESIILEANMFRASMGEEELPVEIPNSEKVWSEDDGEWIAIPKTEFEKEKESKVKDEKSSITLSLAPVKTRKRVLKNSSNKAVPREIPRGTLYYSIDVKKCKIESDGANVGSMTFTDWLGNRFVFEKTKPYYYEF